MSLLKVRDSHLENRFSQYSPVFFCKKKIYRVFCKTAQRLTFYPTDITCYFPTLGTTSSPPIYLKFVIVSYFGYAMEWRYLCDLAKPVIRLAHALST